MPKPHETSCRIPQRWVLIFFNFLGFLNAYAIRGTLSITLTQMVPPPESKGSLNHTNLNLLPSNSSTLSTPETFDWSESAQGLLLSSFYWGFIVTVIPGGLVAERVNAKYTFGLGFLMTAVLNILSPYAIWWGGLTAFIAVRISMGLCGGVLYPASNVLLSQWVPEEERSRAGTLVYAGGALGTVCAMLFSGIILEYSSIGWPAVFYYFGAFGVICSVLFFVFCYNTPLEHPCISVEEVMFLTEKLSEHKHKKPPPAPWGHMLTSKPVWALSIITAGNGWGIMTLLSDLNKYMSSVLKFSVRDNGYLSCLPYLGIYVVSVVFSIVSDWLIATKKMSTTNVRKLGMTIASVGPAFFLILALHAGTNKTIVMTGITIGAMLFGTALGTTNVNVLDLSPNYAGTLMAFKQGFASAIIFFAPIVVGFLTPNQTVEEWRVVFWIIFAVLLGSNAVYLRYGSGKVEEWNNPEFLKSKNKLTKEELQLISIPNRSVIS